MACPAVKYIELPKCGTARRSCSLRNCRHMTTSHCPPTLEEKQGKQIFLKSFFQGDIWVSRDLGISMAWWVRVHYTG